MLKKLIPFLTGNLPYFLNLLLITMIVNDDLHNDCKGFYLKKYIQTNRKLTIQTGWQEGKANYKNENKE